MIELKEEQKILINTIEEFAKKKIEPIAKKIDEEDEIPSMLYRELRDIGLMGILIPQKYGGSELDMLTYSYILEIVGRYSGGLALSLEAQNSLGLSHLYLYGNEKQRERYVPEVIASANPIAWALTEPQSGSDAKNLQTKALKKDNKYIITGSKIFITHGVHSDYLVLFAKAEKGISAFIVDGHAKGIERNAIKNKLGVRGTETAEIFLNEVEVPEENLLGKEGEGYKQAMNILDAGRIAIGAMGVGLAQGAFNLVVSYMKERSAFGSKLENFEGLQFRLAELGTELEAARLMVHQSALLKDQGKTFKKQASMAKYFSSQVAMKISNFAIQVHGGYGYFRDFGIDRYLRDSKLLEIGEGTNEVQRLIIFRELIR